MIAEERYRAILDYLAREGVVRTHELASRFGVSRETIRRDLEHLEAEGRLHRVHGGAAGTQSRGAEPSYASRTSVNMAEKRAIAQEAAALVRDGETLLFDVGTTVLEVAHHLKNKQRLTCLTNSLRTALALLENPSSRVYLLGGRVRAGEYATSGFHAEAMLDEFHVDRAIIGAGGMTPGVGVTDYHEPEAGLRRIMAERAGEVVVVADHSKIGVVAFVRSMPCEMVDVLVTDWKVSDASVRAFESAGSRVIRAAPQGE